ncbi:hypothetical protein TNCV_3795491 [Trichonephila clavipes]|nr:hypothetical protein TNCV_3795491 [Trichonephila clavipes]
MEYDSVYENVDVGNNSKVNCDMERDKSFLKQDPDELYRNEVEILNDRRRNAADMHQPGRPCVSEAQVHAVVALMDNDWRQMIREPLQIGSADTTVVQILKECLDRRKKCFTIAYIYMI